MTVEAVLALAATVNPADITTAAIAEHMQLTQGALFRHFPTKEALWDAVMQWVAEHLLACIDRAPAEHDGPIEALRAMFMSHVDFVVAHPGVPRMLFSELQRASPSPAKKRARALLAAYGARLSSRIERGQASGVITRHVDARAAATLFIGTVQGLVMQALLSGDLRRIRRDAPAVFDIYQRGVMEQR